jgi:nitroreductase
MDTIEALKNRTSSPRLSGTVPNKSALEALFQAAMRAPDHAQLRPWRFLLIEGDDRKNLGDLFVKAQSEDNALLTEVEIDKTRCKPLRAPLILVAIISIQAHPKVPEIEQVLSAGAAIQNILLAAYAQNIGAMWRTGSMAFHQTVMDGLGLASNEKIAGFVYIGERQGKERKITPMDSQEYFETWPKVL